MTTRDFYNFNNEANRVLAYPIKNTGNLKVVDIKLPSAPIVSEVKMSNISNFLGNSKSAVTPNGDIFITGGYLLGSDSCSKDTLKVDLKNKKVENRLKIVEGYQEKTDEF